LIHKKEKRWQNDFSPEMAKKDKVGGTAPFATRRDMLGVYRAKHSFFAAHLYQWRQARLFDRYRTPGLCAIAERQTGQLCADRINRPWA
jgi:hypothetical protein